MSNNITDEEIIMLMNEMSIDTNDKLTIDDYEPNEDELSEIKSIELHKNNNTKTICE
jgi:hypothetical protein